MTRKDQKAYQSSAALKKILLAHAGQKFRLDCGHHVTLGHNFGNNIVILNGKTLRAVCSDCW
jgi:hypothetical protein